ncbi:MAG TPA: hypothetical protein VKT73_14105 [Xanthobacteraceae bacterium]|nr:hypothetical protein [Xanthobacteraceae bacterium]
MPNLLARVSSHIAEDWRALKYAKVTFGLTSLLLVGVTALATWKITESFYAEQLAAIETTTRNLLVQVGQLDKQSSQQTPQVYGSSSLQLLDIHVVFDPPHKPNIFGNVINKGTLTAREPASGISYLIAPRDLTAQEVDNLIGQAISAIQGANRGTEFEPDQVHGFSIDLNMTQQQFDNIKAEKQKLYLIYVVAYRDEAVPAGKTRMTEACFIYTGDLAQGQLCSEHNRAFVTDPPAIK